MSVDWCWALDPHLRLIELEGTGARTGGLRKELLLGKCPWDWPGAMAANATPLQEALAQRNPVEGLELKVRDRRGQWRHFAAYGEPLWDGDGNFAGYRGTARETTQRRRSEALLALEHAVTRELAEASTSRKVLQAVMRVICDSEQWETGGFFRVVDDHGTTRLEVGWSGPGISQEAADYYKQTAGTTIPPGGMLSQVVTSAQPLWVRALRASQTTWAERVRSTGQRATLFTPVLVDSRVIGVFAFASRELREPDARLLQSMRVIGEQAGQFLKRKEAEQRLRLSEGRFRALTDLSSDWYWETDEHLCLIRIDGRQVEEGETFPGRGAIGKRVLFENLPVENPADGEIVAHAVEARQSFHDVLVVHGSTRRFVSVSGAPILDVAGRFLGYRGVGRDVTPLKQAEQSRLEAVRLDAENQALQEGNRLKGLFLTNMSHELRTPLNGIVGFVELLQLQAAEAGDSKADEYLEKIQGAGSHLLQLIEQLLDFAKTEAGRIALRPEAGRLSTLVADVVGTFDLAVRQQALHVTCDLDATVDDVIVDPLRLKQVIGAYLSNAVKFTLPNGRIVVRTRPAGAGCFRLEVEDTGIGIAQADLRKLFAAFHQLSSGHAKNYPGAGMGLALARALIEAQGGTVGVQSVAGSGSIFHFVLPSQPQA